MGFAEIFSSLNIALIAGIIGAILITIGMTKGYKSKETKKTANLIGMIGIGVLLAGAFVPQATFLSNPINLGDTLAAGVDGDEITVDTGVERVCQPGNNIEDTTVTLSAIDKFTTVSTGGTHRYKINGAPALTVSNAGTFTASPGDRLSILWMNGSETASAYFSAVSEEIIPCSGTKIFSQELVKNSTITIDVFNEDGDKINSANNETLAAGDVTTLTARIKGQFQKGQIYGGILICDWNNTAYDDCIIDFGGAEVNVPQIYNTLTARKAKAYSIPAILSTEILEGTITIDVDNDLNPSAVPEAALNLTYYPNDYFINEDTGASYDGPAVEDEDDAQTKVYSVVSDILVA